MQEKFSSYFNGAGIEKVNLPPVAECIATVVGQVDLKNIPELATMNQGKGI